MERDQQYDLLTAALLGAAVGAAAALLLGTGVKQARTSPMKRRVRRGMKAVRRSGSAVAGALDPSELRDQVGDALASARDAISDAVEGEIKDLRKAMRRQRRRLGV